ncbi:unnamed protein product [Gongylonema pulchrum]|uniref:ALIX_LYPXL_bnd domain-containing protein n=1 Tax=Gongylonema pulchrum TaxID=637853 RepID=A0A183E2J9_9BILA|nr:unnamed protein product [Gongylonema pulchrum]
MISTKTEVERLAQINNELLAEESRTDLTEDERAGNKFLMRCLSKDINDAIESYEEYKVQREDVDTALAEMHKNFPRIIENMALEIVSPLKCL